MNQLVLVTGATGFQGGAVVEALRANNYRVRALVPPTEDAASLAVKGIDVVPGTFADAAALARAFAGVQYVALSFPLIFDTDLLLQYAHNVVAAYRSSSVEALVFNTNLPVQAVETGFAAFDSKRLIEQVFDEAQLPYISLRPTIYLDNLAAPWSIPVVTGQHILPYPVAAEQRLAWISHHDLAQFTVAAIQRPQLVGQKFNLGGSQLLTGQDIAASLSQHLGYPVQFAPVSPDDFEQQLAGAFGPATAREIANIYRFVAQDAASVQALDLRERTLVQLPVALQPVQSWVRSVVWQ